MVGEEVRGQHPNSDLLDMTGNVADIVNGGRALFANFHGGGNRPFKRADVKKDTTVEYEQEEKEDLEKVCKGSDLEVRS